MDKIKVAVRVRPVNRREKELGTKCVVDMENNQTILHSLKEPGHWLLRYRALYIVKSLGASFGNKFAVICSVVSKALAMSLKLFFFVNYYASGSNSTLFTWY
ncbi:hypothetical protein LOTGIDRAFT_169554 [Lottia gigantea]|uniref:Kinesin motor domain-containing protein n=1 Tax=Lottia gigantea TaxID=225164 RepID=V3ZL68_LOTGI|nr:hypothetical protein LOTGIDRAFT_169554 [Lottia gigantea]ESO83150.1 hypothetical protein LOTGIDRAFT_169554 [Lottia gigantea]